MMKGLNDYIVVTDSEEGSGYWGIVVHNYEDMGIVKESIVLWTPDALTVNFNVDGVTYKFVKKEDLVGSYSIEEEE